MKINESSWDSVIRIFSGLGGELAGAFAILAGILGFFLLRTGVIGFCPLYIFFKWKKQVIHERSRAAR